MTMTTTMTRFELQNLNPTVAKERELALEAERKAKTLEFLVNHYKPDIMEAAKMGKTSYTVTERDYHPFKSMKSPRYQPQTDEDYFCKQIRDKVFTHKFTDDNATELTEAFRKFFPDCTVTYKQISLQLDVNLYRGFNEITIDWS